MTVRQPWSWAIVHGGKTVENRVRNIAGSYRGPVAIHAGLTEDDTAYDDPMIRQALGHVDDSWELLEQLETGVFIGVVDLVDVHPQWVEHHEYGPVSCCTSPWGQPGAHHLVLAHPRPLPAHIPARGKLGLWTPSTTEIAAIVEQLPEVI
jgi:hypothetical protein